MTGNAQEILKKINYIEADMEIQKQILHAIPTADKKEMERVLRVIAGLKAEIESLRQEIQKIDPETYNNIIAFEKAANAFKQLAAAKEFESVITFDGTTDCTLSLKDGTTLSCLVKAREKNGTWTVLTLDGETCEFSADQVA